MLWQNIVHKKDTQTGVWREQSGKVSWRSNLEPEGEKLKAVGFDASRSLLYERHVHEACDTSIL